MSGVKQTVGGMIDIEQNGIIVARHIPRPNKLKEIACNQVAPRIIQKRFGQGNKPSLMPVNHRVEKFNNINAPIDEDNTCDGTLTGDVWFSYTAPADQGLQIDTCATTGDTGSAEFRVAWRDPEFDPAQDAFYYVRVLQNPTCRWSTYDAIRLGREPPASVPATIRERAWSSPVWLRPALR